MLEVVTRNATIITPQNCYAVTSPSVPLADAKENPRRAALATLPIVQLRPAQRGPYSLCFSGEKVDSSNHSIQTGEDMTKFLLKMLIAVCCVTFFQQSPNAQAQNQYITGIAVGIGGQFGGRSRPFRLIVNNYSAPNQVRQLNDALGRGGQDELRRTLSKLDAGRIQLGTGIGVTANAIISDPWGDG